MEWCQRQYGARRISKLIAASLLTQSWDVSFILWEHRVRISQNRVCPEGIAEQGEYKGKSFHFKGARSEDFAKWSGARGITEPGEYQNVKLEKIITRASFIPNDNPVLSSCAPMFNVLTLHKMKYAPKALQSKASIGEYHFISREHGTKI